MSRTTLATHFIWRELRERYRGSFTGFGWALLQPLLQLAIYAFVFVQIFKARVPGADAPGYVPFLDRCDVAVGRVLRCDRAFDHGHPGQRCPDRQGRLAP